MPTGEEKLASYTGGVHLVRDFVRDKWHGAREGEGEGATLKGIKRKTGETVQDIREMAAKYLGAPEHDEEFAHIYR